MCRLGCSRHPMARPDRFVADPPTRAARRGGGRTARTDPDGSGPVDGGAWRPHRPSRVWCWCPTRWSTSRRPLWEGAPFTAVLLGPSDIDDVDAARAARSGDGAVGDADHPDRGGLGAAQGRRGDARGMAQPTASTCWTRDRQRLSDAVSYAERGFSHASGRRASPRSRELQPVVAAERPVQHRAHRQPSPAAPPGSRTSTCSSGMWSKFIP